MNKAELQELQMLPLFAGLPDTGCLEAGEIVDCETEEVLVAEGAPPEYFYVVIDGELRVIRRYAGQSVLLGVAKRGAFVGEITLLLDSRSNATIRAAKRSRLFRLDRAGFWRLVGSCPSVGQQIFREMAIRVHNIEGFAQQRERLASLGTMAAGLAHELNNPATAARRSAANLREGVERMRFFQCALGEQLDCRQWKELTAATSAPRPVIDPLEKMAQEDRLTAWLEERGVRDAWTIAAGFADAGIEEKQLLGIAQSLPAKDVGPVMGWLEASLSVNSLLSQIDASTARIAELVKAVKSYSHLDRAPMVMVDLHEGIENTLVMLGHKLKGVTVTRNFERALPRILAHGGELNQVWTNLIDNAADAVKGNGKVCIGTSRDGDKVIVEVSDNGPGIPAEVQTHLFEPFYTTKGVGEGTGLGLMLSNRIVAGHGGEIEFVSAPGDTRFTVRLPIQQNLRTSAASLD